MTSYTPEQVEAAAKLLRFDDPSSGDCTHAADILDAYAATLKAAQGGVTEAINALEEIVRDEYGGTSMIGEKLAHIATVRAALSAQQGEVVAWRFKLDDGSFQYGTAGHEVRIPRPIVEATPLYTAPPAQPAERVPEGLRALSEQASPDWKVDDRKISGGSVLGGSVFHYTNGSGQTQLASFSCPRLTDDDPRDPTEVQNANARFAVECVNYVRGLLAASPAPSPARGDGGDARSHRWDEDGERCVVCGDKDWMGGPCNGPRTATTQDTRP